MSLKVGDKVRLKEGLVDGKSYNGLDYYESGMLFEGVRTVKSIEQDGDMVLVECRSGWHYNHEMLEKVEEQTLKEKYLVSDNVVKTRNGYIYLITKNALTGYSSGHNISSYNEDLTHIKYPELDIVEVFERKENVYRLENTINESYLTSIWERKELPEISELEYHILKSLNDKWVQIARDDDGELWLYDKKDVFIVREESFYDSYGDKFKIRDDHFKEEGFKNITFESGVLQIKDLIKKYEEENK